MATGLVLVVLATAALTAAQTPEPAASSWEQAVDDYLAGDTTGAAAAMLRTPAPELTRASDKAYDSWRLPAGTSADADARRVVIRRLQVSALLPLDVLIAVTGRALPSAHEVALEDAAREAWRRLTAPLVVEGGHGATLPHVVATRGGAAPDRVRPLPGHQARGRRGTASR